MSDIGRLHLGVSGLKGLGKLVDEWKFTSPHQGAEAARFTVEVYMRKPYVTGSIGGQRIEFVAHCPSLPDGRLASSDIDLLRQQVEAVLREQAILRSGVIWEDWLEVIVRTSDRRLNRGVAASAVLSVEYKPLKRGRHPEGADQDCTINFNRVAVPFPKPKKAGDARQEELSLGLQGLGLKGLHSDGREDSDEYSYLPDTPENRAALDHIIASLRVLHSKLSDFLGQENLANAISILQAGNGVLALTGDNQPSPAA